MLLGLVQLECCWGLYYWNVVETCTNGMLLGLVLLECWWGLYYWTGVGGVYYWNVVWACTTGMWLGLVLLECCWGLYYWNVVGACSNGIRKQLYHIRIWNGGDHMCPDHLGFPKGFSAI